MVLDTEKGVDIIETLHRRFHYGREGYHSNLIDLIDSVVLKMKNRNIAIVLIMPSAYKKRYWLRISLVTYSGVQLFKNFKKSVFD